LAAEAKTAARLMLDNSTLISVFVVRAFVRLREMIAGHKELARKIAELERKFGDHDKQIMVLFEAIKQLMNPKLPPKTRQIGFNTDCS
jgi:hypothetical protein